MILKKLNELENLIDVPNVDENSEQSIKAMKMLNTINDIRKAVKNNAVLQHVSNNEVAVCDPSMCNKLEDACMFYDPCSECELNEQTEC